MKNFLIRDAVVGAVKAITDGDDVVTIVSATENLPSEFRAEILESIVKAVNNLVNEVLVAEDSRYRVNTRVSFHDNGTIETITVNEEYQR